MRLKRSFTILFAIVFFATVILSFTFIAENIHHDCTGDDCVICQIMETAEEIIGGGKDTAKTASAASVNHSYTESETVSDAIESAAVCTPVSLCDLLTI